jgi:uncharacterized membrane protein
MLGMSRRRLRRLVDETRIRSAIEAAELETSGEIRVSVSTFFLGDVRKVAQRAFDRLGMRGTAERNGVLLFVVPSRRRFVVFGDEGIHAKVGQDFWDGVAAAISEKFRKGDFTGGLEDGIRSIGERLREHFPRKSDDLNELPNDVDFEG